MFLKINNESGIITNPFINYLISSLRSYILTHIIIGKLNNFNEVIKEFIKDDYWTPIKIVKYASKHFKVLNFDDFLMIGLDTNIKLPNTDILLIDACKIINEGTLDIKGFPIFTDGLEYIRKNFKKLYTLYIH